MKTYGPMKRPVNPLVPVLVILGVSGTLVLKGMGVFGGSPEKQDQAQVEESIETAPAKEETQAVREVAAVKAPKASEKLEEPKANATPQTKIDFAYQPELTRYADLKRKVFLTAADKRVQAGLLQNEALLWSLEALLKQPSKGNWDLQALQNQAIDLLLEARGTKAGAAVLRSIVEDSRIEDNTVALDERKSLAGIKAEILYQWSSQEPSRAEEIPVWLPGPVSEILWQNVLAQQKQNVAESALELAR